MQWDLVIFGLICISITTHVYRNAELIGNGDGLRQFAFLTDGNNVTTTVSEVVASSAQRNVRG